MFSPCCLAYFPTDSQASGRRFICLLLSILLKSGFQFPRKICYHGVAVGNVLEVLGGHFFEGAITLLVQHAVFVPAGPEAPAIVIDDIGYQQVPLSVTAKFDLKINERYIYGGPGSFQRFEDAASLGSHPCDLLWTYQAHLDDIVFPDLWVVASIVFEKGLDQDRLEARALAHSGMAVEIRTGGNAPH